MRGGVNFRTEPQLPAEPAELLSDLSRSHHKPKRLLNVLSKIYAGNVSCIQEALFYDTTRAQHAEIVSNLWHRTRHQRFIGATLNANGSPRPLQHRVTRDPPKRAKTSTRPPRVPQEPLKLQGHCARKPTTLVKSQKTTSNYIN